MAEMTEERLAKWQNRAEYAAKHDDHMMRVVGKSFEEACQEIERLRSRLGQAVNIVFDGPPSHEAGRFVEVETDDGQGLSVGEWREGHTGYWYLRIESPVKLQEQNRRYREAIEAARRELFPRSVAVEELFAIDDSVRFVSTPPIVKARKILVAVLEDSDEAT